MLDGGARRAEAREGREEEASLWKEGRKEGSRLTWVDVGEMDPSDSEEED